MPCVITFLPSVDAISEEGTFIINIDTGIRVGPTIRSAKNFILVVGSNKITKTNKEAYDRVWQYVLPIESARLRKFYNGKIPGSQVTRILGSAIAFRYYKKTHADIRKRRKNKK